jgi:hypothetical protein
VLRKGVMHESTGARIEAADAVSPGERMLRMAE